MLVRARDALSRIEFHDIIPVAALNAQRFIIQHPYQSPRLIPMFV
jgi:hypothetical protein